MSLGRAVPWTSWGEWAQVQTWLLSQAREDVQRGLHRVTAWRARGRVPLGVDSTACLVEAQLRDRMAAAASGAHPAAAGADVSGSESELRLQYSMAIVRLVNGIADSSQRGRVAASVASLAASAGLPRILVDLRHEATHNELPSLAALRVASRQGLEWLRESYWARQEAHTSAAAEKLAGLVQEYLELHTAAAAKVAASAAAAAADSDASDADEVGPSAAAAAAAAAASASAGRKAGGRSVGTAGAQAAGGAAAGDGLFAGRGEGYQAAEAKRRRKQLLADIRSAVPRPAAAMLAQAVLAASEAAEAAQWAAATGGEGSAGKAAPAVQQRGLVAAVGHFIQLFPQLPPLLLQGAVDRLAAAGEAGDDARASSCLRWMRRLLPAAQQQQQQGGMQAVLGAWACSQALAQQLLATALPAQAAAAQQAACQALRGAGGSGSNGGNSNGSLQQLADAWQQAVGMLTAAAGRGKAARAAASLAALVGAAPATASQPSTTDSPAEQAGSDLAAAAAGQQALLQQLERRVQPSAKRPAEQQGEPFARKRWRSAQGWQACAIGALPCAADPNGRVPALDSPSPPQLPAAFVGQQAAAATEAAAQDAAVAIAEGSKQGSELRDAVAALLQEPAPNQLVTASWPAPDRFWAAAGGAEAGGAAAQEGEDGGTRPARSLLPTQVTLLV